MTDTRPEGGEQHEVEISPGTCSVRGSRTLLSPWQWQRASTMLPAMPHDGLNARQQVFAAKLAEGGSQRAAYLAAGYDARGATADEAASRLSRNVKVRRRVRELQAKAAKKVEKTVHSLVADLDDAIAFAKECKNPAAVVSGIVAQARLLGLITDKAQIEQVLHKPAATVGAPRELSVEEWLEKYGPGRKQ
jgi:phage terminase small subunit